MTLTLTIMTLTYTTLASMALGVCMACERWYGIKDRVRDRDRDRDRVGDRVGVMISM